MIRNIIFLVLISTVGIVGLTYLVAPKPEAIDVKKEIQLHIKYMPQMYKFVGEEKIYEKQEVFENEKEYFLLVGNHESLAVINDVKKYIDTKDKNIYLVANISSMPLVLKKFAIEPTLEKLMEGRTSKMIFDNAGDVVRSLALNDANPLSYFLYKINTDGTIKKLYTGKVKVGALDGLMSEEEKKKSLEPIVKFIHP